MIRPGEEWGRHRLAPSWADCVPISDDHYCEFCGSREWTWVYPLLNRPVWMRLIDFVIADWWCVCDACRPDVENARVDELKPARGLRRLLPHERDQLRRDGLTSTRSTAHR